jgi:hypothetical protein
MTVNVTKPALNIREKLAELDKPSGIAGEAMLRADSVQEQRNLIGAGRKNLIINGGMQVSQRGDYTSATAAVHDGFWLDRWVDSMGTVTANRHHKLNQVVDGITTNSARLEATSNASGYLQFSQKVEELTACLGREVTMSVWVKSNYAVNLYFYNGISQVAYSAKHPADGQWHRMTLSLTVPTNSTQNKCFVSTYDGAVSAIAIGDYFEVALFQLELGSVATDFEHRSYGEELALCQRYYYTTIYQKRQTSIANGSYWHESLMFPTQMRTAPTCVWTTSAGNWFTVNGLYEYADGNGVRIDFRTASVSGSAYLYGSITADAEL